ncbi:MAG TPA: alpha/beta hydrolase-fold protein [Acidobacteriaceae bacterium]|jgi:S-formylglutathione hydrolase FrmB|nr:alpha/beta hydrolase-fold protein [Acidobacteriaceae bacterium]
MTVSSGIRKPVLSDEMPGHAGVRLLTFYSSALRRRADVTMYLPPGGHDRSLPLMILMHGVYGSHWNWWALGDLPVTANEMLASGEIGELAIAMPSDGLWGDGSGYVLHKDMDAESWIMDDVPARMQELFPQVRCDGVYLAGLSMGGYGALRLGAKFAERVAGISAHSAVTSLEDLSQRVQEPIGDYLAAGKRDADVLYWMRRNRAHLPPIRFDCGTEDSLLASNRALHQALLRLKIRHEYEEHPGGHDWAYWKKHVRSTLRFVSDLAREAERKPNFAA